MKGGTDIVPCNHKVEALGTYGAETPSGKAAYCKRCGVTAAADDKAIAKIEGSNGDTK